MSSTASATHMGSRSPPVSRILSSLRWMVRVVSPATRSPGSRTYWRCQRSSTLSGTTVTRSRPPSSCSRSLTCMDSRSPGRCKWPPMWSTSSVSVLGDPAPARGQEVLDLIGTCDLPDERLVGEALAQSPVDTFGHVSLSVAAGFDGDGRHSALLDGRRWTANHARPRFTLNADDYAD